MQRRARRAAGAESDARQGASPGKARDCACSVRVASSLPPVARACAKCARQGTSRATFTLRIRRTNQLATWASWAPCRASPALGAGTTLRWARATARSVPFARPASSRTRLALRTVSLAPWASSAGPVVDAARVLKVCSSRIEAPLAAKSARLDALRLARPPAVVCAREGTPVPQAQGRGPGAQRARTHRKHKVIADARRAQPGLLGLAQWKQIYAAW